MGLDLDIYNNFIYLFEQIFFIPLILALCFTFTISMLGPQYCKLLACIQLTVEYLVSAS